MSDQTVSYVDVLNLHVWIYSYFLLNLLIPKHVSFYFKFTIYSIPASLAALFPILVGELIYLWRPWSKHNTDESSTHFRTYLVFSINLKEQETCTINVIPSIRKNQMCELAFHGSHDIAKTQVYWASCHLILHWVQATLLLPPMKKNQWRITGFSFGGGYSHKVSKQVGNVGCNFLDPSDMVKFWL